VRPWVGGVAGPRPQESGARQLDGGNEFEERVGFAVGQLSRDHENRVTWNMMSGGREVWGVQGGGKLTPLNGLMGGRPQGVEL
jgi:hypothetical protein